MRDDGRGTRDERDERGPARADREAATGRRSDRGLGNDGSSPRAPVRISLV